MRYRITQQIAHECTKNSISMPRNKRKFQFKKKRIETAKARNTWDDGGQCSFIEIEYASLAR